MKSQKKKEPIALSVAPAQNAHGEMEKHLRHFCNVTSHELGNTLGAVIGELEYAVTTSEKADHHGSIVVALKAAERALHLALNMRYFAVQTRLEIQRTDLSQLLLDTVDMVEEEFKKRRIEFAIFVDERAIADVDISAIQHVLLNLLWNAAHAMPRGGKSTISLQKKDHQVEICLSDTGEGISPHHIEKLFEPYSLRTPEDESQNHGLGLAVAKALIESHGGTISVRSDVGKGTNFFIELPFDPKAGKVSSHAEKRRFRRVHLTLPAELTLDSGRKFLTYVTILSTGGCFLSLSQTDPSDFPNKNAKVSLKISHYDGAEIEIAEARVASVLRAGSDPGIGLEFMKVTEKAKHVIKALVRSHSSFDKP